MKALKDREYGSMASIYQMIEIDRLNNVLREHGIKDKSTRYQICSDYFFPNGLFLDQDGGPFVWQGKQFHPVLAFAERKVDERGAHTEIEALHVDDHANLYWSAEANLDRYFNKLDENITAIKQEHDL
jgi:hypothetical protein